MRGPGPDTDRPRLRRTARSPRSAARAGPRKVVFQRDIGIQEKVAVQVRLGQYGDICIAAETHAKGFQLAARAVPVQRLPQQELEQQIPDGIRILPPLTHIAFLSLVCASTFAVTDSPALQREALYAGKSALLLPPVPSGSAAVQNGRQADRKSVV